MIEYYPAGLPPMEPVAKILFAPGDFGMWGFAVTIARTMASWGYEVHALDTRHYLETFTSKTRLEESEVVSDFRQIAEAMNAARPGLVTLIGWSEGAGLCLLAAAAAENKRIFSGLITLGLTETNLLGWRWSDVFSEMSGKDPTEPLFRSADHLPNVTPLPLLMIQSSHDQYIGSDAARSLFSMAREPKRFVEIEARNHRFEGDQPGLFAAIREGLDWVRARSK